MASSVLVIAGSDPGGGAGLQADIKTLTVLGVHAAAAVTCVTVQDSTGLRRVEPLPPDLVREQIMAVLRDQHVTHVKIGMLGNGPTVAAVAAALTGFAGEIILDPVLTATAGGNLLEPRAMDQLWRELLPMVTVLTPNLPELAALTGMNAGDEDFRTPPAVLSLMARLPRLRLVIVTGGHGTNPRLLIDRCWCHRESEVEHWQQEHPRHPGHNTHGTGCTFASAFTAWHLRSRDDRHSFLAAAGFMDRLVSLSQSDSPLRDPAGCGPLAHYRMCPIENSTAIAERRT